MGNPNEIIVGKCYIITTKLNEALDDFVKTKSAVVPGIKKTTVIRKALSLFLNKSADNGKNDYTQFLNPEVDFDIRHQIKIQAALQKVTMSDLVCQIIAKFIKDN